MGSESLISKQKTDGPVRERGVNASLLVRLLAQAAVLSVIVSACGLVANREQQERNQADFNSKDKALARCAERYPENSTEYIAKMNCSIEAYRIIRAHFPYPDLFDQEMAFSALTAERLQAGRITKTEATAQLVENHSRQVAEEQRRNIANRTVIAQERTASAQEDAASAAGRANAPFTCSRIGNAVSCF